MNLVDSSNFVKRRDGVVLPMLSAMRLAALTPIMTIQDIIANKNTVKSKKLLTSAFAKINQGVGGQIADLNKEEAAILEKLGGLTKTAIISVFKTVTRAIASVVFRMIRLVIKPIFTIVAQVVATTFRLALSNPWSVAAVAVAGIAYYLYSNSKVPSGKEPEEKEGTLFSRAVESSGLTSLIIKGESFGGDYKAIAGKKKHDYKLTELTIGEILELQKSKKIGAVGRYQMKYDSLREAAEKLGVSTDTPFDEKTQDKLFYEWFLRGKRKDIEAYITGKSNDLDAAALALAKEWSSIEHKDTGKSYYPKDKATTSSADVRTSLQDARARYMAGQESPSILNRMAAVGSKIGEFLVPTNGTLTSLFGWRKDPKSGREAFHKGIDIAGAKGSPVYASAAGTVNFAGHRGDYGNLVSLDHGGGLQTLYGHNDSVKVKTGDRVAKGEVIALMGNSGKSTGPHLHFEIIKNGESINPISAIPIKSEKGSAVAANEPQINSNSHLASRQDKELVHRDGKLVSIRS
jgi:murein DD-endopeptidase MepM/ murein hydrolase activator NlpD